MKKNKLMLILLLFISLICLGFAQIIPADVDDYYKFDNNLFTSSTGNNNGTNVGSTNTTGFINDGRSFDGTNDYINLNSAIIPANDDFSISFWYKKDAITNEPIISQFASGQAGRFLAFLDGGDDIRFFADGVFDINSNISFSDNYDFVTFTFEEGGDVKLYINSTLAGTDTDTGSIYTGVNTLIGQNNVGTFGNFSLDELAFYNIAFTQSQIEELEELQRNGIQYPFNPVKVFLPEREFYNTSIVNITATSTQNVNMFYSFPDEQVAFYPLKTDAEDYSGNGNDGTVFGGVTFNGSSAQFDGVDDYVDIGDNSALSFGTGGFSHCFNIISEGTYLTDNNGVITKRTGSASFLTYTLNSDGRGFKFRIDDGVNDKQTVRSNMIDLNELTNICIVFTSTPRELHLYKNGLSYYNDTTSFNSVGSIDNNDNLHIGAESGARFFNGSISDVKIWNRALTPTEISNLYNNEFQKFGSDSNSSSFEFNLSEKINASNQARYTVYVENVNGTDFETKTITQDLVVPYINGTTPAEYNQYTGFNLSNYINWTDGDTCTWELLNGSTYNCNDEITWITNGNQTYNISVEDVAGNIIWRFNQVTLVNPYQTVSFNNTITSELVQNYTLGGIFYTGPYAQILTYDLGLDNHTLLFDKVGFALQNITLNFNLTSDINQTYQTQNSKIVVNIYDRDSLALVTGTTTLTLVATTGANATTTTGQYNFSGLDFIADDYQIIASNPSYLTETVYFTYDNQATLNVDIFMVNNATEEQGTIILKAIADTGELVNNAICKALEWRTTTSSFVAVAQGLTNVNGETRLNIELNTKLYKFSCEKEGTITTSNSQIISTTGQTLPIILDIGIDVPSNSYEGITGSVYNSTFNATHERLFFDFNDDNGLVTEACLNVYKVQGTKLTLLQQSCSATSTGQIQLIQDINTTYTVRAVGVVIKDDVTIKVDTLNFYPDLTLEENLANYGLNLLIPLLFAIIGMSIGFMLKPKNIYISVISTIVMTWLAVLLVPSTLSVSMGVFITTICGFMLYMGYKSK